jgi:Fe-S-cluster containining protein
MRDSMRRPQSEVFRIYKEIDAVIGHFQIVTGLRCPSGCGACCETQDVEATVLEALPAAEEVFRRNQAEMVISSVEEGVVHGSTTCVFYCTDPCGAGRGRCSYYEFRPLVCRLFGFASRRNKLGVLELSHCKPIKEAFPTLLHRALIRMSEGLNTPVYQDSFMHIASIRSDLGYRRLPVNLALKSAMEYLYWKDPKALEERIASF